MTKKHFLAGIFFSIFINSIAQPNSYTPGFYQKISGFQHAFIAYNRPFASSTYQFIKNHTFSFAALASATVGLAGLFYYIRKHSTLPKKETSPTTLPKKETPPTFEAERIVVRNTTVIPQDVTQQSDNSLCGFHAIMHAYKLFTNPSSLTKPEEVFEKPVVKTPLLLTTLSTTNTQPSNFQRLLEKNYDLEAEQKLKLEISAFEDTCKTYLDVLEDQWNKVVGSLTKQASNDKDRISLSVSDIVTEINKYTSRITGEQIIEVLIRNDLKLNNDTTSINIEKASLSKEIHFNTMPELLKTSGLFTNDQLNNQISIVRGNKDWGNKNSQAKNDFHKKMNKALLGLKNNSKHIIFVLDDVRKHWYLAIAHMPKQENKQFPPVDLYLRDSLNPGDDWKKRGLNDSSGKNMTHEIQDYIQDNYRPTK